MTPGRQVADPLRPGGVATHPPPLATMPRLCVVLHDVAPGRWDACLRVLAQLRLLAEKAGVALPVSLLLVPQMHGDSEAPARYVRWLHNMLREGHEPVLHGLTHHDESPPQRGLRDHLLRHWYTAGEGEFAALDERAASQRLAAGLTWARALELPVSGFVAPAWLMSEGAWRALATQPLQYTCTLRHIVRLPQCQRLAAPALVFSTRAAWRRQASLLWNRALARWAAAEPLLRLELHPHDADHRAVLHCWSALLLKALRQREAVTLDQASRMIWPGDALHAERGAFQPLEGDLERSTPGQKTYADVCAHAARTRDRHASPRSAGPPPIERLGR